MIVIVASAIIQKNQRFLFVQEFKALAKGKWGLPGGKLIEGESIIECLRREVLEETGYTITSQDLIAVINKPRTHENNSVIKFVFKCTVAKASSELPEHSYDFLSLDQVRLMAGQSLVRGKELLALLEASQHDYPDDREILQVM